MELTAKPDFSNVVVIPYDDVNLRTMKNGAIDAARLALELAPIHARIEEIKLRIRVAEDRLRQDHKLHGLDQISLEQEVAIRFEQPQARPAGPPREQVIEAEQATNGKMKAKR
jgi:hypothetical protein